MLKIDKKYSRVLFIFLIAFLMAFSMSGIMLAINAKSGFDNFFKIWMKAFIVDFPVALLITTITSPIFKQYKGWKPRMISGTIMGLVMSFLVVTVRFGFVGNFFFLWMKAFAVGFCTAAPLGMTYSILVSKLIKAITA